MRLIIKIGGNMEKDMKKYLKIFKGKTGTHTVYLKSVRTAHILSLRS